MTRKQLFRLTLSALCCSMFLSLPATASPISDYQESAYATACTAVDTSAVPYADGLQWYYQIENGKMYKRLYNTSTGNWVGDWIYVTDVE